MGNTGEIKNVNAWCKAERLTGWQIKTLEKRMKRNAA
jgi:hypothetical protein